MDTLKKKPIGQILCEMALINQSQLKEAIKKQKTKRDKKIGQILLDLGYITETQLNNALRLQNESRQ